MLCVCSVFSSRYTAQTTEVVLNISTVGDDNITFDTDITEKVTITMRCSTPSSEDEWTSCSTCPKQNCKSFILVRHNRLLKCKCFD